MTEELSKKLPKKQSTTTDSISRVEKLEQQKARVLKQLALAKNREKEKERRKDTRRKILIGAILMTEAETKPELYDQINRLLDRYLTREDDRKLFPQIPAQHRKEKAEDKQKATA